MTAKIYRLTAPDGSIYPSQTPGQYGGNSKARIYGRLDCSSARAALSKGCGKVAERFAPHPGV